MAQDPQRSPVPFEFPEAPSTQEVYERKNLASARRDEVAATGFGDLVSNAISETWALAPWFAESHSTNFEFEPGWSPTPEEILHIQKTLPEAVWDDAIYAKNAEHSLAIQQDVQDRQQMQGLLAERFGPVSLVGSYIAAGILDPVNIAMMAASGPLYTSIAQSGKFAAGARFLRTGALAGTEAVSWAALRASAGDVLLDESDILTIGGFGAVLGGAFGTIFGKYAPEVADKANAIKFATDGATISEKAFLATRRGSTTSTGQRGWLVPRHLDDEPFIKFRPPALYDENQRAYGYVSVLGTPGRGTVGINIAKSPFEEMSFLQGGIVQYKNKSIRMAGHIVMEDGNLVVKFNVNSIRTKGTVDIFELRKIEEMVNKTMRDFLDDMDAHGLGDFLRRTGADDPTPGRPAPLLLEDRPTLRPEVLPDEPLAMLPRAGQVLDGEGNARIPGDSAITIEARVDKMIQDHGIEVLDRFGFQQMVYAHLDSRQAFINILRDISENRHLGKEFIDSLEDFRPLAKLRADDLERSDVFSLLRWTKHKLRDSVHASAAKREAARVIADVPAGQHFKGGVLEEAYRISRDPKTDVHLVWMSPEEFSGFALPLSPGVLGDKGESVESLVELLKGGTKLDEIPTLTIDRPITPAKKGTYEVLRHNGRHRAAAFKELGITEIPVLLKVDVDRDPLLVGPLNLKGSSLSSLPTHRHTDTGDIEMSLPLVLRNQVKDEQRAAEAVGQVYKKSIPQSDHPFPIRQSPSITFASIDEATAALRRDAILAKGPKLTISASKASPKATAPKATAPKAGESAVVYHGGKGRVELTPEKLTDGLGTHVGTEKAGIERLRNLAERGEDVSKHRVLAYEVTYTKPLDIGEDLGVWTADKLGKRLVQLGVLTETQIKKILQKEVVDRVKVGAIRKLLLDKDIDALSYINKAEDAGSRSSIVLDPEKSLVVVRGQAKTRNIQPHLGEAAAPKATASELYYHGTTTDLANAIKAGGGLPGKGGDVWLSPSKQFASDFVMKQRLGGMLGAEVDPKDVTVLSVRATPKNIFDFRRPEHIRRMLAEELRTVEERVGPSSVRDIVLKTERDKLQALIDSSDSQVLAHGKENYASYERVGVYRDMMRRVGFDASYEIQADAPGVVNLRLFDPSNQLTAAPKAPRRIATEYTATISDDAHKLFNRENADFNFPIPKEVRVKVRAKEEGLNAEGGKYDMYMWGEEVPLFAKTKKELREEIHTAMETPILIPKLAKHFREDKLIGPEIPEVPALLALSRASQPDELSGFTTMRGNKELTNAEMHRLIHASDPALRPYGEVMTWYHGTRNEGFDLPSGQPEHSGDVFASPNRDWSVKWAKVLPTSDDVRVIEMVITPKNVFDGNNPDHVRKFVEAQLPRARADVKNMERKLAEAVKASDPMAVLHRDAVQASQSILDRLLRSLESDEALRKYGTENLTWWGAIEDARSQIHALGFDAAFESEAVGGLTAQNIRLFDPENQIHIAKKAKEPLMPTELVAVKQGHLLKLDELETIISVVETKHPEYALTPAWQGFLDSVAGHRQSARRPQWHRSVDPEDITVDIPPIKKQPKKKPFEGVSEEDAAKFRAQAAKFDELAEDLQPGDRILQIGDVIFIHNARTGRGISLQDLVDEINRSADDVVAETARQENRVFNQRNLDAFRNAASRGGDDVAKLDFDAPFKEAGVHGPTLGGPGNRGWNSRKTQLQNTISDAFNWLGLHGFGNQAGAETRAGKIVTVIEDVDSWLRHGLAIDRDNLSVTLAAKNRKAHKSLYKEWASETKQSWPDRAVGRAEADFRRGVARFLRNDELLSADPSTLSKADQLLQKAAQSYSDTYADILTWLVKHDPLGPWADIAKNRNRNYFPRIWSENGHAALAREFGEEQVQELIATALKNGSVNGERPMSMGQAMRFAELYMKKVGGNTFQMSWLNHPKWGRKDPKEFMQMLMDELGVSQDEAARFTALFSTKVDDGTHGKYRVRLDETTSVTLTAKDGTQRSVSFDELLNNDVRTVTDTYLHSVLSVAGEREIMRLFSKKLGVEGVLNSIEDIRPHLIEDLVSKGAKLRDAEEMFDDLAREITGTRHSDSVVYARNMRALRDANYTLGAGSGFGLAALGDAFNSFASHGIRNALQSIGILRKMTKSGARLDIDDDLKFIAEAAALTDNKLNAMKMNPVIDELGDLAGTGGRTAKLLRQAATTMSDVSGINAVTKFGENLAMKVHALQYIRMMLDGEMPNSTRMAQMGYTEEAWLRDAAYMRRYAKRYMGEDGVETIKPNFGEWDDQTGVRRFITAIESEVTSQVVRADMNDLPRLAHKSGFAHATFQMFSQFRSFGITANRSMLVRNVKANDARAYITFLSAMAGGALVYTIKQRLRHGDDEEAFQEAMEWDNLVQGSISMSAIGATTELGDAAKALLTGEGMTGHRFTPGEALLGDIPTARTADAIFRSAGLPFKVMRGEEISSGDYRALRDISLIGNHPVVKVGANALQTSEN
tara:strand:- start:13720 stop:21195 length:7476 start_codon:yes stop_codon:yes gene_type:complete